MPLPSPANTTIYLIFQRNTLIIRQIDSSLSLFFTNPLEGIFILDRFILEIQLSFYYLFIFIQYVYRFFFKKVSPSLVKNPLISI